MTVECESLMGEGFREMLCYGTNRKFGKGRELIVNLA